MSAPWRPDCITVNQRPDYISAPWRPDCITVSRRPDYITVSRGLTVFQPPGGLTVLQSVRDLTALQLVPVRYDDGVGTHSAYLSL